MHEFRETRGREPVVSKTTGTAHAAGPSRTRSRTRIEAVDVLRGLVMVIMALDHTREFFTNYPGNPLDPQKTNLLLYTTRWVTHLCAPVFVFLAGTSIFLQQQKKEVRELTWFLVTRGLWLIGAELTLVHLVFHFNWQWNVQVLEVIWAIGASMIIMSLLVHLGVRATLVIGAALIVGHNAFDAIMPQAVMPWGWLWQLLHVPGLMTGPPTAPPILVVAYPLVPWVGVMAIGYAFGFIVLKTREDRISFELRASAAMLGAFILLRWSNWYGDPFPWTAQAEWWRTLLSFLTVQKYPPSLLFVLATLGVASLIMALIEFAEGRGVMTQIRCVLQVYGRVPFFYFLLHIALIHLLAVLLAVTTGNDWRWWFREFPKGGVLTGRPPGFGTGLVAIWCIWIAVVACCYPVCKWYDGIRSRSRRRLFSYL
jgi:uncharacterized membrane protein